MRVEYRVLGPLEVLVDGEPVPVPAGRGRALLILALGDHPEALRTAEAEAAAVEVFRDCGVPVGSPR
ncbi:hypothetical protein [Lentzea sp. HUAS12]|uniref:hypothetical protein n=1 Tax=Lentzea sp. HUAS12 TaxID=2951806 RepID=UPI00209E7AC6|nr:hypothetical protein [Lentzea sp. HUAS12]USX49251.1 hypothetical protein ND450_27870 [Lentzea sp. HUAS12]